MKYESKFFKKNMDLFGVKYACIWIIACTRIANAQSTPGARDHHGFVYDESRDVVVLFAGNDVNQEGKYIWNQSTWEWDGSNWLKVAENSMGKISSMGTCYDPHSKTTLSVGGVSPELGDIGSTWIWNGNKWSEMQNTGLEPRLSPAMAYDRSKNEILLFSGCAGRKYPTDTWQFKNGSWEKVSEIGPPGICRGAMFYDMIRERIVLFGGSISAKEGWDFYNGMWEWDGSRWLEVDQGKVLPTPRSNMLIAYDENRKKAILYGGNSKEGVLSDLWEWNGYSWSIINNRNPWPGPREVYGIAYHRKLEEVVLYGGRTSFGNPVGDMWSWNGNRWIQIH